MSGCMEGMFTPRYYCNTYRQTTSIRNFCSAGCFCCPSAVLGRLCDDIMKWMILLFVFWASAAMALDEGTAAEIAACPNRPGYQKLGEKTLALLQEHGFHSMLIYYHGDETGEGVTADDQHATRWAIVVHVDHVGEAIKLLSAAPDKEVRNTALAKPILPPSGPPPTIEHEPPLLMPPPPPKKKWWRFWQ